MRIETSKLIKSLRKSRCLTMEQLGVLSGMSKSQISRMEKGELGSPQTVDRLMEAMGYTIEIKVVDKYSSGNVERQKIIDVLSCFKKYNSQKYGIESLALFGSISRGEQNDDSDVDILISLKTPSLYILSEIESALQSVLKRKIDLVSAKARKRVEFESEIANDLIYV